MLSINVILSSAYLISIAVISGQLEPSSIIVRSHIYTVFVHYCTPSSASSNSHLIFHGPHKSTQSSSQDLIILQFRSGSLPSLMTLVNLISLHVLHVAVNLDHVNFARELSFSLLAPGCFRVS